MSKVQCDYCGRFVEAAKASTVISKYGDEMVACAKCERKVYDARAKQSYYEQRAKYED